MKKRLFLLTLILLILTTALPLAGCGEEASKGLAYEVNEDGRTCTVTGPGACEGDPHTSPQNKRTESLYALCPCFYKIPPFPDTRLPQSGQPPTGRERRPAGSTRGQNRRRGGPAAKVGFCSAYAYRTPTRVTEAIQP